MIKVRKPIEPEKERGRAGQKKRKQGKIGQCAHLTKNGILLIFVKKVELIGKK